METGRELDALVAEKVMEWEVREGAVPLTWMMHSGVWRTWEATEMD